MEIIRGDIYFADLSPSIGSEQGGLRPVVVIQNDIGNKYSPTIIVAAITSKLNKSKIPTHIYVDSQIDCLPKNSIILLEQIRTIDRLRLKQFVGRLSSSDLKKVNNGLLISLQL